MASNNSSKTKIWIGASVLVLAAAGVLVAGGYLPPNGKETAGTIVPAERYRAAQVGSSDVKLGDKTIPQVMQTGLVSEDCFRSAGSFAGSVVGGIAGRS